MTVRTRRFAIQSVLASGAEQYKVEVARKPAEVQIHDELDISDEAKLKLYQTNAERVFHLTRT